MGLHDPFNDLTNEHPRPGHWGKLFFGFRGARRNAPEHVREVLSESPLPGLRSSWFDCLQAIGSYFVSFRYSARCVVFMAALFAA
jgi:hypothetical protein